MLLKNIKLIVAFLIIQFLNCEAQIVFKKNYDYATLDNFNCYETSPGRYVAGIAGISMLDSLGVIQDFKALIAPPAFYWKTLISIPMKIHF